MCTDGLVVVMRCTIACGWSLNIGCCVLSMFRICCSALWCLAGVLPVAFTGALTGAPAGCLGFRRG